MKRFAVLVVAALLLQSFALAQSPASSNSFKDRVTGLTKKDGFFPYYWDEKKGEMLFELSQAALNREFLYFTSLGTGVGSTEVFADRSSFGSAKLCRLRRVANRVLVIEENTGFRAPSGSADLKHSIEESFPTSVLAALPIETELDGTLLINANPLLIRDANDLLSQLKHPTRAVGGMMIRDQSAHADWRFDEARSVIDLDESGSFPLNTEVEALLTFTTDSEADMNQPDLHVLSVREHHSFLQLPAPGFEPREKDPRVGFFSQDFQDFSQNFDKPLNRYLIARWRLEKKDPGAAVSEPVKPLVFYVDRAIPEPVRSAAKRGAASWNDAFEQAGFKNALRIEDLPEGTSPLDIRYPTIQWTNRSGRGWSVGQSHVDPRTGEIVHAVVQLDSHRMRTVNNYWQATIPSGRNAEEPALDAFSAFDGADPQLSEEQQMQNRLALLTCHEMGHVLGLEHNFVASTYGRGSVMDYFAPRIKIRPDGTADLSDAYMQGVGSYDRVAIQWGYSQGPPNASAEQERTRLDAIVKDMIAKGTVWGNYADPRWNAYDDGPDPVTWLKQTMLVRDALLVHYGPQMLHAGEPNSMLTARFPLVYLFHRYALASAVNVVGSAMIPLSLAGDGQKPIIPWPADAQKQAIGLMMQALQPSELDVPAGLWRSLGPDENRDRNPESFDNSSGYLFSPQDGAREVATVIIKGLLDPKRMQRLMVLNREDRNQPSPAYLIAALVKQGFAMPAKSAQQEDLLAVVQGQIAERLMILAVNGDATPEVRAAALAGVRDVQGAIRKSGPGSATLQQIDHEIMLFQQNPEQNTPKVKDSGAPAGPPV
jgi:hypothetical protein